ncbi:retrovirus-related pol polyprotein from transposon TNT 1-94 [Tanacetum coccineum]
MKNENHSKVCGSGGLLLQAPEVLDWDITNPQFMICDLYVLDETRQLGMATKIVEKLVKIAQRKGVELIFVVVDAVKVAPKKAHFNNGFKTVVSRSNAKGQILLAKEA